jgi:hypothetical protein
MVFRQGEYVRHGSQPNWGIGRVLSFGENNKVAVFFLRGGKRILYRSTPHLKRTGDPHQPILELARTVNWKHADRHVYVVELRPEVFEEERKFAQANPHWLPGKLCIYLGVTGLPPEERFRAHLRGERAARFVQRYGRRLLPEWYQHLNPLPYALAREMEAELARQLRFHGHAVWQSCRGTVLHEDAAS